MSNEPAVRVEDLRCAYGDFTAVDGVSFEVDPGEIFALLGTNGAGKTTTLETVEGHRRADGGRVEVLGLDPWTRRHRVRRQVGIMLQAAGFPGDLTVAEAMRMSSRLCAGRPDPEGPLARVDLVGRRDVRISDLSGGERRRLELAVAILGDPALLFLDEATSGMDPESRDRTLGIVRDLVDRGTTVVMTTHYLEEAEVLADRVAIMHEGRIRVLGTTTEVLARQPARIEFRLPGQAVEPDLAGAGGWARRVVRHGDRWTLETADLQADLARVLGWADSRGVRLVDLNAHHASLDDVFRAVVHGRLGPPPVTPAIAVPA